MTHALAFDAALHDLASVRPGRKSIAHRASLALVWMTFATSGIVFSEPAPVDALAIGLIVVLPVVGLVAITPALLTYLSLWLVAAASAFLAATLSLDTANSAIHTSVTLYLYVSSFVLAAFFALKPVAHTRLVLGAWLTAALVAAACGLVGYFEMAPGAFDIFTKFGRVSGTFKDPNVFGPFLVAPFLYALHLALTQPLRWAALSLAVAGFLALAVFLSFSRGAWVNLALALVVYVYLAFVTAPARAQRTRILALSAASAVLIAAVIGFAVQNDKIATLLEERASATQSYDVGPDGRFGGQVKAVRLILENPFGIGSQQFTPVHHHEEVHNVFLSIVLNAGWLGGGVYWIMVGLTLILGGRHLLTATQARPLYLIAYAAFLATALEGIIIDSDHWRCFYLLMALVWGHMCAPEPRPAA